MATTIGTAYVQIAPSTKGIGSAIASQMGGEVAPAGKKAGGLFGSSMVKALGGVIAAAGIGSFLKDAVSTTSGFNDAISQVSATMGQAATATVNYSGKSMTALEAISAEAQRLGAKTSFSASQAADGFNVLAMAGYKADDALAAMGPTLSLAEAGALDIAEAADYTTGIIAGFGLQAEDTSKVGDYLATMASSAKGDVRSFGTAISTAAGMLKTTGQSLEDGAVALEIFGNHNVSAAEAGNALNRVLKNVYQPTDQAAKAFKSLGVEAYDAAGNARALPDVLRDLNGAMDGMSEAEKNQTLSKLFDSATLKTVPFLINDISTSWDGLADGLANSQGAAEKMAATMKDNLTGDITAMNSALEGAKINLVQGFTPALRGLAQEAGSLLTAFNEGFASGGLSGGLQALGAELDEFSSGLWAKGVAWVQNLIGGISEGLPGLLERGASALASFVDGFTEKTGTVVEMGLSLISNIATGLAQALPNLVAYVPKILTTVGEKLVSLDPKIISTGWNVLITLLTGIINAVPELLRGLGSLFGKAIEYIKGIDWKETGRTVLATIVVGLSSIGSSLSNTLKSIGKDAGEMLKNIDWKATGEAVINFIVNGLKSIGSKIWETLKGIGNDALEAVKGIDWHSLGSNIIDGLKNGISDAGHKVKEKLKSIAKDALKAAKDFLGIRSPSRVFAKEVGRWIPAGIAEGITDNSGVVVDAVSDLSDLSVDSYDATALERAQTAGLTLGTPKADDRLDVMISLLARYLPECAENKVDGTSLLSAIDRSLGMAVI